MHHQITLEERYAMMALKKQHYSLRAIARELGRAPSTISREFRRNPRPSGRYSSSVAHEYAVARRRRSRRGTQFSPEQWLLIRRLLERDWSPEQISGWLARQGIFSISHETIYLHIWRDKAAGGDLYLHLRQAAKKRRKRYRAYDSRGRLAGKRHISERPPEVETRAALGHWEIDTIKGDSQAAHSAVTMVERATGFTVLGKLERHTAAECSLRVTQMILDHAGQVATVTADNGTEFHSYELVEEATGALFYFATPHHSWERGTCENTNGLIRQYLPKRKSMAQVTQDDLDVIAERLNTRPRKRLGYKTPEECYVQGR
jgi:IS30 family transposase